MDKDSLYSEPIDPIEPFTFDEQVALVFDDMISRSVPQYDQLQTLLAQFAVKYYQQGTALYDLGCSTGETLSRIAKLNRKIAPLIGIDSSDAMIHKAIKKTPPGAHIHYAVSDIQDVSFQPSSVMLLTYILQFLPLPKRGPMLAKIYSALVPNGILLLSEKILIPHLQAAFTEIHEDYKRVHHYSDLEIRQKREALENVLISLSYEENIELLHQAGFKKVQPIFQYLNFVSMIAIK